MVGPCITIIDDQVPSLSFIVHFLFIASWECIEQPHLKHPTKTSTLNKKQPLNSQNHSPESHQCLVYMTLDPL